METKIVRGTTKLAFLILILVTASCNMFRHEAQYQLEKVAHTVLRDELPDYLRISYKEDYFQDVFDHNFDRNVDFRDFKSVVSNTVHDCVDDILKESIGDEIGNIVVTNIPYGLNLVWIGILGWLGSKYKVAKKENGRNRSTIQTLRQRPLDTVRTDTEGQERS